MTDNEIKEDCLQEVGIDLGRYSHSELNEIKHALSRYHKAKLKLLGIGVFSSCYAVFDEEGTTVQLYQTEDKANKGLWEFQNSHPSTEFYIDTMQIN